MTFIQRITFRAEFLLFFSEGGSAPFSITKEKQRTTCATFAPRFQRVKQDQVGTGYSSPLWMSFHRVNLSQTEAPGVECGYTEALVAWA